MMRAFFLLLLLLLILLSSTTRGMVGRLAMEEQEAARGAQAARHEQYPSDNVIEMQNLGSVQQRVDQRGAGSVVEMHNLRGSLPGVTGLEEARNRASLLHPSSYGTFNIVEVPAAAVAEPVEVAEPPETDAEAPVMIDPKNIDRDSEIRRAHSIRESVDVRQLLQRGHAFLYFRYV